MAYTIRQFQAADLVRLQQITAETFGPVSIDGNIDKLLGETRRSNWKKRKLAAIADDCRAQPDGVFVAEDESRRIVAYITTRLDRENGVGHIPNLAVDSSHQNQGIARSLILYAMNIFRHEGLALARIETLEQNSAGQRLYPSLGFVEVARQIHY